MSFSHSWKVVMFFAVAGGIASASSAAAESAQGSMAVGAVVSGCRTQAVTASRGADPRRNAPLFGMATICSPESNPTIIVSDSAHLSQGNAASPAQIPPSGNIRAQPEAVDSRPRTVFVTFVY